MPIDQAPVEFEVTEDEMREVTTEMFSDTQAWHSSKAIGNFQLLVDAQIFSGSGIYTAPVSEPEMYERIPYQSTGA